MQHSQGPERTVLGVDVLGLGVTRKAGRHAEGRTPSAPRSQGALPPLAPVGGPACPQDDAETSHPNNQTLSLVPGLRVWLRPFCLPPPTEASFRFRTPHPKSVRRAWAGMREGASPPIGPAGEALAQRRGEAVSPVALEGGRWPLLTSGRRKSCLPGEERVGASHGFDTYH